MRLARSLALAAAAGAGAAAVLATTTGVSRGRVLDVYVLFVGALAMFGLVHATRSAGAAAGDSLYERALRRRTARPERPKDLARIEREVAMSATTAFDLHIRLRPLLRLVAAHRLASRRGLELDSGAGDVRALLSEEAWELLQPEREPPDDRLAPGLPLARQRGVLDELERI